MSGEYLPKPLFELNDLARERLAAGVDLFLGCAGTGDGREPPRWARIRMDQPFALRLLRLRDICAQNQVDFISDRAGTAAWEPDRLQTGPWTMRVGASEFWVHASTENGFVQSPSVALDHLWVALGKPAAPGTPVGPDEAFVWYGDALVYDPEPVELFELVELLKEQVPHLPARERELEMAQHLAAQTTTPVAAVRTNPARRAARL